MSYPNIPSCRENRYDSIYTTGLVVDQDVAGTGQGLVSRLTRLGDVYVYHGQRCATLVF